MYCGSGSMCIQNSKIGRKLVKSYVTIATIVTSVSDTYPSTFFIIQKVHTLFFGCVFHSLSLFLPLLTWFLNRVDLYVSVCLLEGGWDS